jgi:hypothetical protein
MSQSGQPSTSELGRMRERIERLLAAGSVSGAADAGEDLVLGPDLAVDAEDNVVAMRASRRLGDPLADYVDLWFALERFHERATLTEEGWSCLTEDLQRPLELRLAERRPATVEGALKALEMARYLMENLDSPGNGGSGDWYRRLRNHLVESAHAALKRGLSPRPVDKRQEATGHAGHAHAEQ